MNVEETGRVLGIAALFDNRKVDVPVVVAWHRAIGDLSYDDAAQAVQDHYGSDSAERLMPGHIRARVKAIRAEKIARSVIAAPPHELTDDEGAYRKALKEGIGQAAEGNAPLASDEPRPLAITGPSAERPELARPKSLDDEIRNLRRVLGPARARTTALASPQEIARRQAADLRAAREAASREERGEAS